MAMTYTVQPGDSLWEIARRYGLSLQELLNANPQIRNPDQIYPGQQITIPVARPHKNLPRVDEPYPPVRVEGKNPDYARLLQNDYAGRVSEVSAVMQYQYHHLQMEYTPGWEEAAELEKQVSIVEMGHMDLLGKTLILLGSTPRYEDGEKKLWTPAYVAYCDFDPCAQLEADIKAEKEAILHYGEHIKKIGDHYIQALLRRIIKDEELHIQLFSATLAKLCTTR